MSRALAALLFPLSLALACARPAGVIAPLSPGDGRPQALLTALERESETRHALRGVARLALDGPGGSGRAKQVLLVERPARLRVEILGFLNQTVAVLTTDGESYRLFQGDRAAVREGPVHAGLLLEVAGLALSPELAVQVLLGALRPPGDARVEGRAHLEDGGMRLALRGDAWTERLELDFDEQGQLRRFAVRDADDRAVWEARYADYRPVGGAPFAHEIELLDAQTGSEARVSFGAVELNPALPPGVFDLSSGELG